MILSYAENVGQNFFQGISVTGDENSANYLMCLLAETEAFRNKLFYWLFYSLEYVKHWANPDTDFWKVWLFWWIKAKGSSCLSWFSSVMEGQM